MNERVRDQMTTGQYFSLFQSVMKFNFVVHVYGYCVIILLTILS